MDQGKHGHISTVTNEKLDLDNNIKPISEKITTIFNC